MAVPETRGHAYGAAENCHLEVLKWARAKICPWDELTCNNAAENGYLEQKWVRPDCYPWDEWTCDNAARNGHREVLMWTRANGCP